MLTLQRERKKHFMAQSISVRLSLAFLATIATEAPLFLKRGPQVALVQQCRASLGVSNTTGISVYSREYTFMIVLTDFVTVDDAALHKASLNGHKNCKRSEKKLNREEPTCTARTSPTEADVVYTLSLPAISSHTVTVQRDS